MNSFFIIYVINIPQADITPGKNQTKGRIKVQYLIQTSRIVSYISSKHLEQDIDGYPSIYFS
jgi:hypothetical protein